MGWLNMGNAVVKKAGTVPNVNYCSINARLPTVTIVVLALLVNVLAKGVIRGSSANRVRDWHWSEREHWVFLVQLRVKMQIAAIMAYVSRINADVSMATPMMIVRYYSHLNVTTAVRVMDSMLIIRNRCACVTTIGQDPIALKVSTEMNLLQKDQCHESVFSQMPRRLWCTWKMFQPNQRSMPMWRWMDRRHLSGENVPTVLPAMRWSRTMCMSGGSYWSILSNRYDDTRKSAVNPSTRLSL